MKNRLQFFFILLSLLFVLGCSLTGAKTTEKTVSPQKIDTLGPTTPPQEPLPQSTPDKEDRWMLYEEALAARLLSIPMTRGAGYSEWEILGQDGQEVYLWAICQVAGDPEGSATSAPVVVTLANFGGITRVDMPRDGTLYGEDIRSMFPSKLQNLIFDQDVDVEGMWAHIQSRHTNPEPPLIVLENFPLP